MPTKPFNNKFVYDSGRLRHKVQFVQDVTAPDGFGGTTTSQVTVLETWAGKEEISNYTQVGLNQGRTEYNQYQYFVIRNRAGFMPVKDMRLLHAGTAYIVQSVKMLDDPCTFLKVLCVVAL